MPIMFILSPFANYDYTVLLANCAAIDLSQVHLLSSSTTVELTCFLLVGGDSPFRFWSPGVLFLPRELRKQQTSQMKRANGKILSNIRILVSTKLSSFF
jgi:hypothetical protein